MTRLYRYIGPPEILAAAQRQPAGTRIKSKDDLRGWLLAVGQAEPTATFVVTSAGELLLASRHSEHVAAASGNPVRSAGEITFGPDGAVVAATNQSTGYGPEPDSWSDVAAALDRLGIDHPAAFTQAFDFRRCQSCGMLNLVKDGWLVCDVCGHDLPSVWNLETG